MPHTHDSIPTRDADFDGWMENLVDYVDDKTSGESPVWTHIPLAKVTDLKQRNIDWHTAYTKTLGPHTAVDTELKKETRKTTEAFIRQFIAQYLKFDPVTNEDRTAMNIHNKDTTHTPIGKPTTRVLITELKALGGFQTEIRFQDETTPNSRAIPYGMNGCLLNYTVSTEKATDYALLKDTTLMTHSLFTLSLGPEAEGKFLSCAPRWQSERGELGPWGEIQHIVIG
jgi:hypothetical protein